MRVFIALDPPKVFCDECAFLARSLSAQVKARFSDRNNYHLTLAFLGDVAPHLLGSLEQALERAVSGAHAVLLEGAQLGSFGKKRDATLWLGIKPSEELTGLARSVRDALVDAGFSFDAKPFKPHITLARRADLSQGDFSALVLPSAAVATQVVLYKSMLEPSGARYKALFKAELAQDALLQTGV